MLTALVVVNVFQLVVTNNRWMGIFVTSCTVSSIVIFPYMKWKLLPSLQDSDDYGMSIHSLLTFVLILVGIIPLELLLITDMNLGLINSMGFLSVIKLCDIGRGMLAIAVFLLVSMIYWMLLIEIRKAAILYIKCKKLKREIYE